MQSFKKKNPHNVLGLEGLFKAISYSSCHGSKTQRGTFLAAVTHLTGNECWDGELSSEFWLLV